MSFDPYIDAVALARSYQSREATVRETVEELLARINKYDSKLGAFQALYAEAVSYTHLTLPTKA